MDTILSHRHANEQAIATRVIESQAPWVPIILEVESWPAEKLTPSVSIRVRHVPWNQESKDETGHCSQTLGEMARHPGGTTWS